MFFKYVFDEKFAKYVHLDVFYVLELDYSGSFDMHILKWIFFSKVRKNRFFRRTAGGRMQESDAKQNHKSVTKNMDKSCFLCNLRIR